MAAFLVGCLLLSLCGCNVVINVREQSDKGSTDETVTTTEEAESYVIDDGVPWIDSNLKENAVNSAKPSVKDDLNLAVNYDWMCSTDIPEGYVGYKLTVKGLKGGHSGMDISLFRGNANKIVCRILKAVIDEVPEVKVADIKGGSLRNAIPFEAEAVILIPSAASRKVKALVEKKFEENKLEYQYSDPDTVMFYEKQSAPAARYISPKVIGNALKAILACYHGVGRMSDTLPGLTETSTNMAIIRTEKGHLTVHSLTRSSIDSAKIYLADSIRYAFELAGAKYSMSGAYSGWTPKLGTPMIKVLEDTYKNLFGKDLKITATHGGLECAIMGAKYPNWEMVSIGPTIVHPHSPDERVKIDTVAQTWKFLTNVLENIPEK